MSMAQGPVPKTAIKFANLSWNQCLRYEALTKMINIPKHNCYVTRFLFEFFTFLYSIPDLKNTGQSKKRKSQSVGCLEDVPPNKRYLPDPLPITHTCPEP